jgi:integrase/recombinase XerD
MTSTQLIPDPAEIYISRLGTAHSRATIRSALRTIARALGVEQINWAALTYADLAGVRASLNQYSTSWGNTCWTITRQVLHEGRRLNIVDHRLVDDVLTLPRLRGQSGRLGRDLDDSEVDALLAAVASDSIRARRDGALLALLVYGGLRRSECASVKVVDWCTTTRMLNVRHGKGRKVRSVPLPTIAANLIDHWLDVRPGGVQPGDGLLLRSVDRWNNVGSSFTSAAIPKILEQLCKVAHVAPVSAHAFRARRISQIIGHGDPLIGQRFAGHSSVLTTSIYDRRGLDALIGVVVNLASPGKSRLRVVA